MFAGGSNYIAREGAAAAAANSYDETIPIIHQDNSKRVWSWSLVYTQNGFRDDISRLDQLYVEGPKV